LFPPIPANVNTLVVFDFDLSLIDDNSDTWVVEGTVPEDMVVFKELRSKEQFKVWTDLMAEIMRRLRHERGLSRTQIEECLARIATDSKMLDAARLAASTPHVELRILSDANTEFIRTILEAHSLQHAFKVVATNPAEWDDEGCLRVRRFHDPSRVPHGCTLCPKNLCKGEVLRAWLATAPHAPRVFYIGDGRGDLCPALALRDHDIVFARRECDLLRLATTEHASAMRAEVVPWASGDDVLARMRVEFSSGLPTTSTSPSVSDSSGLA
jgi:pyridoxal phosphate phosphatase PHOSPHO2